MTKYEVVVTDPAIEDIVNIVGYIQKLTKSEYCGQIHDGDPGRYQVLGGDA